MNSDSEHQGSKAQDKDGEINKDNGKQEPNTQGGIKKPEDRVEAQEKKWFKLFYDVLPAKWILSFASVLLTVVLTLAGAEFIRVGPKIDKIQQEVNNADRNWGISLAITLAALERDIAEIFAVTLPKPTPWTMLQSMEIQKYAEKIAAYLSRSKTDERIDILVKKLESFSSLLRIYGAAIDIVAHSDGMNEIQRPCRRALVKLFKDAEQEVKKLLDDGECDSCQDLAPCFSILGVFAYYMRAVIGSTLIRYNLETIDNVEQLEKRINPQVA